MDHRIVLLDQIHYKAYLALMNEFRPVNTSMSLDDFREFLTQTPNIYVYMSPNNDKPIASITIMIEQKFIHNSGRVGHIEDLYVAKGHRSVGIGGKMLEFSKEYCRREKCYKMILYCDENLMSYYKTKEFEEYGMTMKYNLNY